jgi:endonuclease/exonuclease/phosphatase family metal-dependent hydrolase
MLLDILGLEAEKSQADATILTGDFNSSPSQEAYQIVTGPDSNMVDVCDLIPVEKRYGNELTFTGFSDDAERSRIDFIFARKHDLGERMIFDNYAVLSNRFDDGVYSSDHRACVADFKLISN